MHLSWLQAFLPSTLKKMYCTLPNSEHTLEKQWVLRGQTQTSSGREPDSPDSSSPPPPLLENFNAKYLLWTRGNKAIMGHTARQSKSKPVLLCLLPHSPTWRNNWAEASQSWAMHGSCPSTGTPSHPSKAQPESQYLQSSSRKRGNELWAILYENSVAHRYDPASPFCNIKSNSTLHCLREGKRSLPG